MYLTRRQKEILDFIREHILGLGYAPSIEEIGARFGLSSTATVHKHLSNLEEKGLIRRSTGRSRAIELCGGDERASGGVVQVPLLGRIAAGRPIEAVELPESIELPESLVGRRSAYMLKVLGDSMIDEQIRDGDYVIVERRDTAEDGQIVVALIGGEEVTLKRFYREKDGVRLQPANVNFAPIILKDGEFKIQGVVIGILRKY
jgi:repressor LexA